jgi:hypothetical protein
MPIPIEKLRAVTRIIAHANCPDGYASAMILRDVLDVPVQFVQYNTKEHLALPAEPGLLFCDFTPPYQGDPDRTQEFVDAGAIVIDHHKTARECIEAFGEHGIFGDEATEPGLSGALLAYRHVWLPLKGDAEDAHVKGMIEDFATLAGIRDTWQKNHPRWAEACLQATALMFPPSDYLVEGHGELSMLLGADWGKYLWAGRIREIKFRKACERALKDGFHFPSIRNTRVIMFQGVRMTSDAAEMAGDKYDLIVGYEMFCEDNQPKIIFSTRSRTDFDCSALAKRYGGGGHTKAAGFNIKDPQETPFRLFERLLNDHEILT